MGEPYDLSRLIGPPLRREGAVPLVKDFAGAGLPVLFKSPPPHEGEIGRTGIALPGRAHGRGQTLGKRQAAKPPRQLRPGHGRARYRDGGPAIGGHFPILVVVVVQHPPDRRLHRSGTAGIEPIEFLLPLHPYQGEGIGPDAVCSRLHHSKGGGGGHRRVHRIAAAPQDLQSGGGSLGRGCVYHSPAGIDGVALGGISLICRIKESLHTSVSSFFLSYRWQATKWPGSCSTTGGFSLVQISMHLEQRV